MLNRPHSKTIAPVVVVGGINVRAIEVQVVGISSRVERCTPVVAVRAAVFKRRTIVATAGGEEHVPLIVSCHLLRHRDGIYGEAVLRLLFFPPDRKRRATYEFALF